MLNIREVEAAIADLETRNPSLSCCAKLADLYTVRDHLVGVERSYPVQKMETVPTGDSDFLRLVSKKDSARAWAVMDELMESLYVVNPRVYNSVMRKINDI